MRKQRTIQKRLEQQIFCFGGDAEGGNGGGGGNNDDSTQQPGPNTRTDSRGNTVNFNVGPAPIDNTPNFTRTLPNGVVVEDYSRPFQGQQNLSNFGSSSLSVPTAPVPENNLMRNLSNINTPVSAQDAIQEAMQTGRFNLGGGFYAGNTPTGFGLGFETRFAEGGAVTSGIASLGLPQTVLKSTKS